MTDFQIHDQVFIKEAAIKALGIIRAISGDTIQVDFGGGMTASYDKLELAVWSGPFRSNALTYNDDGKDHPDRRKRMTRIAVGDEVYIDTCAPIMLGKVLSINKTGAMVDFGDGPSDISIDKLTIWKGPQKGPKINYDDINHPDRRKRGIGDVNGTASGSGARFNAGKSQWGLLPLDTLEGAIRVLEGGAEKYNIGNWERGMSWRAVYESAMRHMASWQAGEELDQESGEEHLSHVICNMMFLIRYKNTYPEGDDRVSTILKQMEALNDTAGL